MTPQQSTFFLAVLLKPFVSVLLLLPGAFLVAYLRRRMRDGKLKRFLLKRIN